MKNHLKRYLLMMAVVIITACSNSNKNENDSQKSVKVENSVSPFVTFCRNINYNDTATLHDERTMKKIISTIGRMLPTTDSVETRTGLTIFFNGMRHDENALSSAMTLFEKYLNNPVSPYRNENLYINLLSTLLDIDSIPPVERTLASERLRIVSLNRPGTLANDFRFEMPDGSSQSLYSISSPMTLLVFYNPECSPCKKILAEIAANPTINTTIRQGQLAVVAIYAEGNRDVWRDNIAELPENWTIGYDLSAILDNDIYNLPAMPTLYLLDADKRVLLKDPDHRILGKLLRKSILATKKS